MFFDITPLLQALQCVIDLGCSGDLAELFDYLPLCECGTPEQGGKFIVKPAFEKDFLVVSMFLWSSDFGPPPRVGS